MRRFAERLPRGGPVASGADEEHLLGRRCTYHSVPTGEPNDALVNLLAPPPEVYSGQQRSVVVTVSERARRVLFLPLPGEGGTLGVLGLVDPQATAESPSLGAEPAPDELHDALRRWRRRWPAWHRPDRLLGVLCTLAHAVPVFTFDLGPGETASLPDLPGYTGPVMALMSAEGGLRGGGAEEALMLGLPVPNLALRLRSWQAALGDQPVEDLPEIARRFILPSGYIRQTAAMALAQSRLDPQGAQDDPQGMLRDPRGVLRNGGQVITPENVRQAAVAPRDVARTGKLENKREAALRALLNSAGITDRDSARTPGSPPYF